MIDHICTKCGKPASFYIDDEWLCGDHWRMTGHYNELHAQHIRKIFGDEEDEVDGSA